MKKYLLIISCLAIISLLIPACSPGKQSRYSKSKALLDTFVTITVVSDSSKDAEQAIDKAFNEIEKFGSLIDFFSDKSDIALINRKAGISEVKVSPVTLDLIEKAIFVAESSGGAFDITIGPVMRLWDFHRKIKPSDVEISQNIKFVNYKNIVINKERSTVFLKKKGMMIDLGGLAKGYAADIAVDILKRNNIGSGIVAIAGDIVTFGTKSDGKAWNIGIADPRNNSDSDEIIAKIALSDKAISTSGDYQRFFVIDGQRFHHLLDPKTGYPADTCRSVSIVTEKGIYADAFSTAVFVLGAERGMKLVQELGQELAMDAVVIDKYGKIHTTPALKGRLKIERSS